ncbi:UDP-N-acetylmuramoyl-L-alanyl-D-glutamate--2,6-diaminopimelate ligase [Pseudochelatococcus contaminans]|uniref:UDP-N-acetylmuramoyl-L-alanyl-D-glutamate--2,6-diaminopimelate ligase n=1 Tax=Pseudochelatococcus contaminans TaxID=1538103 RepID=A0A7W6EFC1_9HYPH|nr:UDP-N-acetylmuramoyl-L-alanyl-D-glutamate--2,6-diaminopimelate ligase [Pseudochelatococcus contaminans]MBB3808252.1 UDP-N-acetylmuramoyl-L-alanyl-D-glutamate--2,6-diaminopimelate ligase [Pseudochelatococcus contaminans]
MTTSSPESQPVALSSLLPEAGASDVAVTGLQLDSRRVEAGDVFFAVPGNKLDGRAFALDAARRGAAAIVGEGERPVDLPEATAWVTVANVRAAVAHAAARFYPRQPAKVLAVTGTSGKSSVADFTRQIFLVLGQSAASLGTIGVVAPSGAVYGSLTTPDSISLHRTLDELAGEGVTHLVLEASSHGLDQHRLDGVRFAAGAFTNLGRDHLDYHPDVEAYLAAKLRLFSALLPQGAPVVINADSPEAARVATVAQARGLPLIGVGVSGADVRLESVVREGFGQRLRIGHEGRTYDVTLPLAGDFQASNALVAAGLALAAGEVPERVFKALEGLTGVKGRLERVAEVNGGLIVVDYAHKPDALASVLDTLRGYATGRLVVVFGAGGDRDRGKRPLMGAIAAEKADIAIVTDDNPRSEEPAAIRAEVLAGARGAAQIVEIGDRSAAIHHAVRLLGAGDVLVVAGKGHETGQIVGQTTLPFSDHDTVLAAVAELTS